MCSKVHLRAASVQEIDRRPSRLELEWVRTQAEADARGALFIRFEPLTEAIEAHLKRAEVTVEEIRGSYDAPAFRIVPRLDGHELNAISARLETRFGVEMIVDPKALMVAHAQGLYSLDRQRLLLDLETLLRPEHPSRVFIHEYRHVIVDRLIASREDLESLMTDRLRVAEGAALNLPHMRRSYLRSMHLSEISEAVHDSLHTVTRILRPVRFTPSRRHSLVTANSKESHLLETKIAKLREFKAASHDLYQAVLERTKDPSAFKAAWFRHRVKSSEGNIEFREGRLGTSPVLEIHLPVQGREAFILEMQIRGPGVLSADGKNLHADWFRTEHFTGILLPRIRRKAEDQLSFLKELETLIAEAETLYRTVSRSASVDTWFELARAFHALETRINQALYRPVPEDIR